MNHWQNFYHDATAEELDQAAATLIALLGFSSEEVKVWPL